MRLESRFERLFVVWKGSGGRCREWYESCIEPLTRFCVFQAVILPDASARHTRLPETSVKNFIMRFFTFIFLLAFPLLFAACGLAEDDRDTDNKYIYIENQFSDPHFRAFCMEHYDLNDDGHVSRYEAQRILKMECPGLEIASLNGIGEFSRLQRLDCSDNALTILDLSQNRSLTYLNCSGNRLERLDIDRLLLLASLDCSDNRLTSLLLPATRALVLIDCQRNDLRTLDVSNCGDALRADVSNNPSLTTVYCRASQRVTADAQTQIVVR